MNKLKEVDIEFAMKNKSSHKEALDYCWEAGFIAAKTEYKRELKKLKSLERRVNAFLKTLRSLK